MIRDAFICDAIGTPFSRGHAVYDMGVGAGVGQGMAVELERV